MKRIERLLKKLKEENLDGIFLLKDTNIRYLSGFTGSDSYAVISASGNVFITDFRYTEQAAAECEGFEILRWRSPAFGLPEAVHEVCKRYGIKRLGFENEHMSYARYEKLAKALAGIEMVSASGLVENIRCAKDENEIKLIREAVRIADEAFKEILQYIRPGATEKDIERELQYIIKKKGADDISFPSIVASGKNGSMPHAVPSDKQIREGEFVTLDFGAMYKGYRSDMTRTVAVGHVDEKQKEIYRIVKEAQEAGKNAVKAGVPGKTVDDCARGYIANAGYGDYFGHGLGHGVGLDIHELPYVNTSNTDILEEGCVVTVEPGIYLPDWGGVRIEDSVLVTKTGAETLTKSTKELIVVGE